MTQKKYDLQPGEVYGRLTVVAEVRLPRIPSETPGSSGRRGVLCVCSCDGKETLVRLHDLVVGRTRSCGCLKKEGDRSNTGGKVKLIPLGTRFGSLVVIENLIRPPTASEARRQYHYRTQVKCLCDCGREVVYDNNTISQGKATSCGNGHKGGPTHANYIHGESYTRLYRIWGGIWTAIRHPEERTRIPVTMCDQWADYVTFRDDVLRESGPYVEGLFLTRVDVRKEFGPGNVKWATHSEVALATHQYKREEGIS